MQDVAWSQQDRRVTVGQRCGGDSTDLAYAAIALSSLIDGDVVVVADGGAGVPASRAAADVAVRAVVRACSRHPSGPLGGVLREAHSAVQELVREHAGGARLAVDCVVAVVRDGTAAVARAGAANALRVRDGAAEAVFTRGPVAGAAALGLDDGEPCDDVEVAVPLDGGDRLVLVTSAVVDGVDPSTLARLAWTLEPQVAAGRIAEEAAREGRGSVAVQVVRRETPGLAAALHALDPEQQRRLVRWQQLERSEQQRDRERNTAWSLLAVVALLAALAGLLGWLFGGEEERSESPTAPAVVGVSGGDAEGDTSVPVASAAPLPAVAVGASRPTPPPLAARAPSVEAAPAPSDAGGAPDERDAGATPGDAGVDAAPVDTAADGAAAGDDGGGDVAPAQVRPARPAEWDTLDEVFGRPPERAALALRRYIVARYEEVGVRVFDELEVYVRARRDRDSAAVLVSLLERRPPPRTRAWLLRLLPALIAPSASKHEDVSGG